LIDYLAGTEEAANEGYSWYARKMREKPYTYAPLLFPHDGRVREATGKSRAETMESLGFKVEVLPMLPVDDGINSVKEALPMMWIDAEKCSAGLTALKNYRENWDDKLRRSNGALKDWTNHAADSLRYTVQGYEEPKIKRPVKPRAALGWQN
jgi:phage terminase large subunit